jgi:hypothetical protein
MAKPKRRRQQSQAQAYDTTLKTWVQEQARDILPVFLPGAMYEETLNVEIIRPAMRVDKVFKVMYRELDHILHLEFESGSDNDMPSRLLTYHAVLYQEHHLPVISMIVYPFRTRMAVSPWREMSREETLLTFHFLTLPLFTLDAERYVREHVLCMYPLLPTMQGATGALIGQAMDELAELYQDDEVTLAQQFVWMELLLERTDTVSAQEKQIIQERLDMYDRLWEESPKVQKIRAESEVQAMQRMLVSVVKARFPALTQLAQEQAVQINSPDTLDLLVQKIATAPDEDMVRWLLSPTAA